MYDKILRILCKFCAGIFLVLGAFLISGISLAGETVSIVELAPPNPSLHKSLITVLTDRAERWRNMPPAKRARFEKEIILKLLESEGYYDARINYTLSANKINHKAFLEKRYMVGKVTLLAQKGIILPEIKTLPLKENAPLIASIVLEAQNQVARFTQQHNCLFKAQVSHAVHLSPATQSAEVEFKVEASPAVTFGGLKLEGLTAVEERLVRQNLKFHPGECFKRRLVDETKTSLFKTGLFGSIYEEYTLIEDKQVDVTLHLLERSHRTVKAGAEFSSDEGPGLIGGWEHRNFAGMGEKFDLAVKISTLFKQVDGSYFIPSFLKKQQSLKLTGKMALEDTKAFNTTKIAGGALLKKKIGKHLSAFTGSELELEELEDAVSSLNNDTSAFVSVPVGIEYDRRDDLLDPKSGWVVSAETRPFIDAFESDIRFVKNAVGASAYYTPEVPWSIRPTFALRGAAGSISGLNLSDLPSNKRYYTGGGGSIRGYPFQKVGPLSADNIPEGGRSFTEVSAESRLHFGENWGGVVFVDGGNTYSNVLPQAGEGMQWSAGMGVRYFTDFAPLRFDIAVPLDRRRGVDNAFEFYFSIGQAF